MPRVRATVAAVVLSFAAARPAAAADSPACAAAKKEVASTEAEIADLKKKLAALETALATRQANAAKACPAVAPLAGAVQTARLPLSAAAPFFNDALQGTKVRLHTNGPAGAVQDSWVQPGAQLGGGRIPIPIQVPTLQLGGLSGNAYLNDMNSNRVGVVLAGGKFVVTFGFESDGTEVIVRGPQVLLNVEANDGEVVLQLTPGLDGSGRPSFSALDSDIRADMSCSSPNPALGSACGFALGLVRNHIQDTARRFVKQAFDTAEMKSRLGAAVRALLDAPAGKASIEKATGQKVGTIRATRFEADALVIDHD